MSYTMYCPRCKKNVLVKEVWDSKSLVTLIGLLIAGLVPGIVYILIKTMSGDECPECGYTINMMKPPVVNEDGTIEEKPQEIKFCIFCDAGIPKNAEICPKCGNRVRRRNRSFLQVFKKRCRGRTPEDTLSLLFRFGFRPCFRAS